MKQVTVRIRVQDSIAEEPHERTVENVVVQDGVTPLDLLARTLKSLSLSLGDFNVRSPTVRDAEGATLGTADMVSPVSDGFAYEFTLTIGDNQDDSGHSHDSFDVLEAIEVDASVGNEGGVSITSQIRRGFAAAGNWMLNRQPSDDKPIEVISVQHDSAEQWPQMVLNTKALMQILVDNIDAKALPVSIVSIAGLFRSGKSFLLNFFLRYLSHMEKVAAGRASPDDDWFEPTSDNDGTHDRFHWAGGRDGVTKGIHMWPKAFVLRRSSGEKIAVVLMDSQGTEDLQSSSEECVAVFALSMMIASLQIYNVKENINKQTIVRLHEFTLFANKALGDKRDHKHFQTLAFLIRDSDGDCGFEIGTAEVSRALKEGAMRQAGEDLALSFEEISGFLMPHPGKKIHEGLKGQQRNYKTVFEAMDSDFKHNVKDFTQTLLNPDTLRTKQVNGETVTCVSAVNYIKKWTEAFRNCRMPSPQTVGDVTAEVNNHHAVECAVKAYASYIQECCNNAECPCPVAELEQMHEAAVGSARETFSGKCMGEDRHKVLHLQKLDELIKGEHAAFKKINASLAVPVAKDTYDALWDDFIAREKQEWAHYHLKRAAFAAKEQEHRNLAVEKFYEFASRDDESSVDAMTKLADELKISMLERKVTNGVKCYKHHMTIAQNSDELWTTSRMQNCHNEAKKEALDVADLSGHQEDGEFAMAREDLKRQIKVAKASFIPPDMPGDKNANAWDQAIAHYIKQMDRICKPGESDYLEPRDLVRASLLSIDDAKELFEERCAKDHRSPEFKKTLMRKIARQQMEFERVNHANRAWWRKGASALSEVCDEIGGVFWRGSGH